MATEIRVPSLGESVTEATIAKWLKSVGDQVSVDEPLVELETDKVSVEVPAPAAGVISEIAAEAGSTVGVNALLGMIGAAGAAAKPKAAAKSANGAAKPDAATEASPPVSPASASSGAAPVELRVPPAGESVTQADIGEWFKKEGDTVALDEPIVSLETDKASMDVGAPVAGVLTRIAAKKGETVEVGALLAVITPGAGATAKAAPAPAPPDAGKDAKPKSESAIAAAPLSPASRRVATEMGVDAAALAGTGKDGRVTKGDVLAAAASAPQATQAKEAGPAPAQEARAPQLRAISQSSAARGASRFSAATT